MLCALAFCGALTQYFFIRERITEETMGLELICFLFIITFFSFMEVERHIADDQECIRERQQTAKATGAAN